MKPYQIDFLTIATILLIIVILLFFSVPRQGSTTRKNNYVLESHRILAKAIEKYYADHNEYPAMMFNTELQKHAQWKLYTIHTGDPALGLAGITTPVAYVKTVFSDPYANRRNVPFRYYTDGKGWILFSPGPDTDSNIDPLQDFYTSVPQPSPHLIGLKTYNPTNGSCSAGDIWTLKVGKKKIIQSSSKRTTIWRTIVDKVRDIFSI